MVIRYFPLENFEIVKLKFDMLINKEFIGPNWNVSSSFAKKDYYYIYINLYHSSNIKVGRSISSECNAVCKLRMKSKSSIIGNDINFFFDILNT